MLGMRTGYKSIGQTLTVTAMKAKSVRVREQVQNGRGGTYEQPRTSSAISRRSAVRMKYVERCTGGLISFDRSVAAHGSAHPDRSVVHIHTVCEIHTGR